MAPPTTDTGKIRTWILMAVKSVKGDLGATIQDIKKFLDSKKNGISSKPLTKLILKNLMETGHLERKDGKYAFKKSKKKIPGKDEGQPKSPLKSAGRGSGKKVKPTTEKSKQATKNGPKRNGSVKRENSTSSK